MTVGEQEARAEQVAARIAKKEKRELKGVKLVGRMTGKISSLMALAAGKLPKEPQEDFCDNEYVHLLGANIHDDGRGIR